MRTLTWVALSAVLISFGLTSAASAVPDYVKRYWEARQPHPGTIDQDKQAAPAPVPDSERQP